MVESPTIAGALRSWSLQQSINHTRRQSPDSVQSPRSAAADHIILNYRYLGTYYTFAYRISILYTYRTVYTYTLMHLVYAVYLPHVAVVPPGRTRRPRHPVAVS